MTSVLFHWTYSANRNPLPFPRIPIGSVFSGEWINGNFPTPAEMQAERRPWLRPVFDEPLSRILILLVNFGNINSSPPSDAYTRQWIGSALVQIMACRLFGAKPLSKPMMGYCQLDHQEQTSVKFKKKYKTFHSQKCIWKYRLRNGGHFVQE